MGDQSPKPASTKPGAVFLSYASQDAQAAQRICEALRAAGIEAWFDQSELRGGDAWDQSIRKQIKACALFVPIISKHTHERAEGYFRLEWKLAVDRSHLIMANKAFLVPVVIDETADDDENVPEKFREVQWTRLPGGETPPHFVARIKRLLSPELPSAARSPVESASGSAPIPSTTGRSTPWRAHLVTVAVLILGALAYLLIDKPWISKSAAPVVTSNATSSPGAAATAFNPPPHSVAVLPFVNMSGDKDQDYFSDGLTEELLNSLSHINGLQVSARTSSFSFKGTHADVSTIARRLNVASILEGSVRRSGRTVRITAQLNNAATGFHLWSQTYDRDLGNFLKLQTEIADAVANALKVTLLGDLAATIELGGTRNPAAFDAYLRGLKLARAPAADSASTLASIAAYSEAVQLDPNYANAFAGRGYTLGTYAGFFATGPAVHETWDRALADAQKAISIAPGLGDAHMVLGAVHLYGSLDFSSASKELERAVALAPGNAVVLYEYARLAAYLGRFDAAITAARRGVTLDPLNLRTHRELGDMLLYARHYAEALAAYQEAIALDPEGALRDYAKQGVAYYLLGNLHAARASCETKPDQLLSQVCLALVLHKLGQLADAESALAQAIAMTGEAPAYQCAEVYAEWANPAKALSWLETALRTHDAGLPKLRVDPLLDSVRYQARFQAIERKLGFPN